MLDILLKRLYVPGAQERLRFSVYTLLKLEYQRKTPLGASFDKLRIREAIQRIFMVKTHIFS